MAKQVELLVAILASVEVPADVQAILNAAPHKANGITINGDANWYHWPYGPADEGRMIYNPLRDFLTDLEDDQFVALENDDNEHLDYSGSPYIFGCSMGVTIKSGWDEIWANKSEAEAAWKKMSQHPMAFKTKVKVEWFKDAPNSKHHSEEVFFTFLPSTAGRLITDETLRRFPDNCTNMNHAIEVWELEGAGWNKWLKIVSVPEIA